MGSPVTFSGFNKIDFTAILNAVMEQERQPLKSLEARKSALKSQSGAFATLASRLGTLQTAASDLGSSLAFGARTVTTTDSSAISVSAGSSSGTGTYDIVVQELARAQVTATTSAHADRDQTVVASGGTLTIGGVDVTLTGDVTLQGLADAINGTDDATVTATIVQSAGTYQLVLTGRETGAEHAFAIRNQLTGGSGVAFGDLDGDGTSGDSPEDNAVNATDAAILVNNIAATSASNEFEDVIPGATLTVLKKAPATTVTATIADDASGLKNKVTALVGAYNDLMKFIDDQGAAAARGETSSIGRDGLVRSLRNTLRNSMTSSYASGGTFDYLSQVGIGFDIAGKLKFDETLFNNAIADHLDDVRVLFAGSDTVTGAFDAFEATITEYTSSGGLVPDARSRIDDQMSRLTGRINDFEARLAVRREALQREYLAADMTMTQLNSQVSSLTAIGSQYRLF